MAALNPISSVKRIVVKIGSALLVDAQSGALRIEWLRGLAEDINELRKRGVDVLVVSSGSIALGRRVLGMASGVLTLEQSQAAAAVGQIKLARAYEEVLEPFGLTAAQVLMTLDDSRDRRRYLNSRATLSTLLECGAVPIVNENDTVATDEIRFGDNDRLGAQVASMAGADVLVLLSDVDGFYSGNPKDDAAAKHFPIVKDVTPEFEAMAGGAGTEHSSGGMKTKLLAAKTAMQAGCAMAIMQGDVVRPLKALAQGEKCTWFLPKSDPKTARKKWSAAMKPNGVIQIDQGAVAALVAGNSLLPVGVIRVVGKFQRGDMVSIEGPDGVEYARGLGAYSAQDTAKIKGKQTLEIEKILGYPGRSALVHRDDMVV